MKPIPRVLSALSLAALAAPLAAGDGTSMEPRLTDRLASFEYIQAAFRAHALDFPIPEPDLLRLKALDQAREPGPLLAFLGEQAAAGKVWAMRELALIEAEGKFAAPDPVAGLNWFAEAARRGDAIAALVVGAAYARGDVIRADPGKARTWLALASQNGDYRVKRDVERLLGEI